MSPRLAAAAAWRHARALWPRWTLLPPLPFLVWSAYCFSRGERRWEHAALCVAVPVLSYGTLRTRDLVRGLYPMGLVALLYDGMRFVKNVGVEPHRVHLCDLRALEVRLFGSGAGPEGLTVHDWLQRHASPALDLYAAVPYGTYLFVCLGFACLMYRKDLAAGVGAAERGLSAGAASAAGPRAPGLLERFAWAFLALNVAGFVTYHLYPAAPPWYFHAYGCVVHVDAPASEGPNLARVDALLGYAYFHGFYGRSNDVFGAVPSLHVAYPLLMLLIGWRVLGGIGRAALVAFGLSMCFAAVYLDHHWVIDVVAGLFYALLASAAVGAVLARGAAQRARAGEAPAG